MKFSSKVICFDPHMTTTTLAAPYSWVMPVSSHNQACLVKALWEPCLTHAVLWKVMPTLPSIANVETWSRCQHIKHLHVEWVPCWSDVSTHALMKVKATKLANQGWDGAGLGQRERDQMIIVKNMCQHFSGKDGWEICKISCGHILILITLSSLQILMFPLNKNMFISIWSWMDSSSFLWSLSFWFIKGDVKILIFGQ